MSRRATASFFVLFFGLSLSLHAEDAAKPLAPSADDKDLCSYLKDIDAKTDADCKPDAIEASKAKDPAAFAQRQQLVPRRKSDVLAAYEYLKSQAVPQGATENNFNRPNPDQQAQSDPGTKSQPDPSRIQPPINERTFSAWLGEKALDLKPVYARLLATQNQQLEKQKTGEVSPERRREIEQALEANRAKIARLEKIKDPTQLSCFLGDTCGNRADLASPTVKGTTIGKGAWTQADFDRANEEAKRKNMTPGGKPSEIPLVANKEKGSPAQPGPLPLLPLSVPIGVGLIGYGVYRSRDSYVSENGLNPNPPEPTPEQAEHARKINSMIKSGVVATVLVVGGGAIAEFAAPTVSAIWNEGALVVRSLLGSGTSTLTPAMVGGGTAGAGTAGQALTVEQAGVYAKAALQAGGTIVGAKTASDAISYAKSNKIPTDQDLTQEANKPDPADKGNQYTKAGRSLMKHNQFSRPGSNIPQPKGNPAAINKAAQELVESILSDPKRTESFEQTGRFGKVLEIRRADGVGIRFGSNSEFLHFIE